MSKEEMVALIVMSIAFFSFLMMVFNGIFRLKEKKMQIEAEKVAQTAARYATDNAMLEQRVRVLEQIVTDGGAHTAAQIEALRDLQDREPLPLPKEKARG